MLHKNSFPVTTQYLCIGKVVPQQGLVYRNKTVVLCFKERDQDKAPTRLTDKYLNA